jgi:ATP synthase protein I
MSQSGPPDRLKRLGNEIGRVRAREDAGRSRDDTGAGMGLGLRIGIELIAALLTGLALGWLADRYLGVRPFGLIAGFFLGSAAGIVGVIRTAQGIMGGPPAGGGRH